VAKKRAIESEIENANQDVDARVQQLLRENSALRRKLSQKDAKIDIVRSVVAEAYDVPSNLRKLSFVRKTKHHDETAVLHITDTHYGKLTVSYDVNTCEQRLIHLCKAVEAIVKLRRKGAGINKLVLLLGGDMIEGQDIYPHQAWETDVDIVRQMIKDGPEVIANVVLFLCQLFPEVEVKGVVGNHGRLSKTGSQLLNSDAVFYEIVRSLVDKTKPKCGLSWDLPFDRGPDKQWYAYGSVHGHGVLLIHGDSKGPGNQLGYPWYSVGRKAAQWASVIPDPYEYLYIGHNHIWADFESAGIRILATGSTESDNTHAAKNFASASQPHQRLGFYNRKYGLLANHMLKLS
jgi:hypothetical protein